MFDPLFIFIKTVGNWTGATEKRGVNKNGQRIIVEYDANTDSSSCYCCSCHQVRSLIQNYQYGYPKFGRINKKKNQLCVKIKHNPL